jgi:hypothetical protein
MAKELGAQSAPGPATFESPCYPYVNSEHALLLRLAYTLTRSTDGPQVSTDVTADTNARADYVGQRRAWERALLERIFSA